MTRPSHASVVNSQFGSQAAAYLSSAVHAAGDDLRYMAAIAARRHGGVAIDIGCGGGHLTYVLAPEMSHVTAYDLSPDMLATVAAEAERRGLSNVSTSQASAEALPCANHSVDLVSSRYSAHHWPSIPQGLAEMRRVVTEQGRVMISDVIAPASPLCDTWLQSLELLRDPSHVRNASRAQWEAMLEAAGFALCDVIQGRLRLEYTSWVTRMATPEVHRQAIRALQQRAGHEVSDYFEFAADGSFTLDTAVFVARPV